MTRRAKIIAALGTAIAGGLLVFLLVGYMEGGIVQVSGMRAGDLDGGYEGGAKIPLRRGDSEMIGLSVLKNVGKVPILVESVEPQSTSPELRATRGHIWLIPTHGHLILPLSEAGWPPKHPPTSPPGTKPGWVQPNPDLLSLPASREIPPGREAQVVYGIFLHADPSPKLGITALLITFKQGDRTFRWTLPDSVSVLSWAQFNRAGGGGA